jgi:3-isopropylmalate/(R)-2-methylmalate dehydratase small subunit
MSTTPIKNIISTAVPLNVDNIDTDQIIPARFLKAVARDDFGKNLFADWRFNSNGDQNKEFVLNNSKFSGTILLAGSNFGCGSSREHAAWALYDYGFRAVVSSHFADIFKNNALNNGLLPIQVTEDVIRYLTKLVTSKPETQFVVNLEKQTFSLKDQSLSVNFEINAFKKECLLNGYGSIDYLINLRDKIEEYEIARAKRENVLV